MAVAQDGWSLFTGKINIICKGCAIEIVEFFVISWNNPGRYLQVSLYVKWWKLWNIPHQVLIIDVVLVSHTNSISIVFHALHARCLMNSIKVEKYQLNFFSYNQLPTQRVRLIAAGACILLAYVAQPFLRSTTSTCQWVGYFHHRNQGLTLSVCHRSSLTTAQIYSSMRRTSWGIFF